MSMVQQLIAAVSAAERQIEVQIEQLSLYVTQLTDVAGKINSALDGTTQGYERQMLQQLSDTRTQVEQSIRQLQAAKEQLACVRMI